MSRRSGHQGTTPAWVLRWVAASFRHFVDWADAVNELAETRDVDAYLAKAGPWHEEFTDHLHELGHRARRAAGIHKPKGGR